MRASRRGNSVAARRAGISYGGDGIEEAEEGAQKLANGGLTEKDLEKFYKAASTNDLINLKS